MLDIKKIYTKLYLYGVRIIVWDFDGTLYQDESAGDYIKQRYIKFVNKYTKIDEAGFDKLSNQLGRWSTVTAKLLKMDEIEVMDSVESDEKYVLHLKKNRELVSRIEQLSSYSQFILTNSSSRGVAQGLRMLGFKKHNTNSIYPFVKIFSRDVTNILKPNAGALGQVLAYTKAPPSSHLVIGDSDREDLIPAKKLGCKTAHVDKFWNDFWPSLLE